MKLLFERKAPAMTASYDELSVGDSIPVDSQKPRPLIALRSTGNASRAESFRQACRRPLNGLALGLVASALIVPFVAAIALSALIPGGPAEAGQAFPILRPWLYSFLPALFALGLGLSLSRNRPGFGKERVLGVSYMLAGVVGAALLISYDPASWAM